MEVLPLIRVGATRVVFSSTYLVGFNHISSYTPVMKGGYLTNFKSFTEGNFLSKVKIFVALFISFPVLQYLLSYMEPILKNNITYFFFNKTVDKTQP